MNETDFIKIFSSNSSRIMWFLGAGTSRSSGLPTATDITWDLKLRYYCLQENQQISLHDINNEAVKQRVQSYFDSKGYPQLWSTREYSFYFDIFFGNDKAAQQRYIRDQLSHDKVSLTIGHRSLAALIKLNKAKVIFTTNFDDVIEQAYSFVTGENLSAYNLEGSYAALDALNSEQFPIYAKIHGDMRYQSIKNLSDDLLENDKRIKDCFVAASSRFGLIVSGYSGRDQNVMRMFNEALNQHNPFPFGIYWTVPNKSNVIPEVSEFVSLATEKGVKAHIVETGSFDIMMSKIWRQMEGIPEILDQKVRSAQRLDVNIPMPSNGKSFPIIRTNGLPIVELPKTCAEIKTDKPLSHSELKTLLVELKPNATLVKTEKILGFGKEGEFRKALSSIPITTVEKYTFEDPTKEAIQDFRLRSFFERLLVKSISNNEQLNVINDKGFCVFVNKDHAHDPLFQDLKQAVSVFGRQNDICGRVPNSNNNWSEGVRVKLEEKNGSLYVMLKPEIIITPSIERKSNIGFLKMRKGGRYNKVTSNILDAWIKILFNSIGNNLVETSAYADTEYKATFVINTRTCYSRKIG